MNETKALKHKNIRELTGAISILTLSKESVIGKGGEIVVLDNDHNRDCNKRIRALRGIALNLRGYISSVDLTERDNRAHRVRP
jgi:hypothetical protein